MEIYNLPFLSSAIRLALAVYRISERFPHDEPLKVQFREKTNQVLAALVRVIYFPSANPTLEEFFSEVDILRGFFEVAKKQQWLKDENFEILENAYQRLKTEVKEYFHSLKKADENGPDGQGDDNRIGGAKDRVGKKSVMTRKTIDKGEKKVYDINLLPERQKKILEHISQNGSSRPTDFIVQLSGVNIRTIRRDFEEMLNLGLLAKENRGRNIFYKVHKRLAESEKTS